jgi:hypothetical protein
MALAAIFAILSMAKRRFGKHHSAPVSLPFLLITGLTVWRWRARIFGGHKILGDRLASWPKPRHSLTWAIIYGVERANAKASTYLPTRDILVGG